jgi:murein DD-endopeptidase MepM/ murein hydrolase activator NlpD
VATPRTAPTPTPALTPAPTPTLPVPTASPTPRPRDWAPQSAAGFDRSGEVVDIAFPLKPTTRYHYRDNWRRRRAGEPEPYNHVLARRRGELRRAHDGIDIYTRLGSPVVAPFAGTVIDPATRWQPWRKERYGRTVVVVSNEPQSAGYAALMAHLDAAFVVPGTVVRRGEVIGLAGGSGNADGNRVHLHFELRAPFLLSWPELGDERLLDAFNPYLSLTRADPKRD